MVRRDVTDSSTSTEAERSATGRTVPAGVSPAPVGAGAPGSRPQVWLGDRRARAGHRKPVRRREPCNGKQARGPQHQVKPAASTDEQSVGRAAHVPAKATRGPHETGEGSAARDGGVWGAARVQGSVRNARDPSVPPQSRQGHSNKAKPKSVPAQRESEGAVVPKTDARAPGTNAVTNNAAGGRGPCGGQVVEGVSDEL